MTSDKIEEVFTSVKQEVLNDFLSNIDKKIKTKLKEFVGESNKVDAFQLGEFAYVHALKDSLELNNEITLKTLIKLFADDQ